MMNSTYIEILKMADIEGPDSSHLIDSDEEERAYALLEQEMYANNMINKLTLSTASTCLKENKVAETYEDKKLLKENFAPDNLNKKSINQLEDHESLDKLFLESATKLLSNIKEEEGINTTTEKSKRNSDPSVMAKVEQDDEMAEQDFNDDILLVKNHKIKKKRENNEMISGTKSDINSQQNCSNGRSSFLTKAGTEKKSTVRILVDVLSSRVDLPSTKLEFLCQHFLRLVKNVEDLMHFVDATSDYSFGDKEDQFDVFFTDLQSSENRTKEFFSRLRHQVTDRKEIYKKKILKYRQEITLLGKRINESAWSGAKKNVMRSVLQRYKDLPNQDKATVKTTGQAVTNIENFMEDLHSISQDVDPIVTYIENIPKLAQTCNKMGCLVGDEETINILLNDAVSKLAYLPIKEVCYNLQCTEEDLKQKRKQFATKNRNDKQTLVDLLPPPLPVSISSSAVPPTPKKSKGDDQSSDIMMHSDKKEPYLEVVSAQGKQHQIEPCQVDLQETGSVISDVTLRSGSTINTCQTDYVPGSKSNKVKTKKSSKRQPNFAAATAASKAGTTTKVVTTVAAQPATKKNALVVKSTNSSNLRKSKSSTVTSATGDSASVYSNTSRSVKTTRTKVSTANESLRGGKGQTQKNNSSATFTNKSTLTGSNMNYRKNTSTTNGLRKTSNVKPSTMNNLRKKTSDQLETSSVVSTRSVYSTKSEMPKSSTINRHKTLTKTSSTKQSTALRK